MRAINQAAVRIARQAFGGRAGICAGGHRPARRDSGTLRRSFAGRRASGAGGTSARPGRSRRGRDHHRDADSLDELGLAIDAAKAAGAPCIIASLAYDLSADKTFFVTMMGVLPEKAAQFAEEKGAHFVALNCGTGMDMAGAAKVAGIYRAALQIAGHGAAQRRPAGAGNGKGGL